jgi:AraC family L-rhamnose operon regulatory protein RhaS
MTVRPRTPRPAIYQSADAVYRADTCDRLKQAARRGELRLAGLGRRGYPGARLPEGVLPEVASVGFWDAPRNQSWGLDWHRNEGIEFTFLARGRLEFAVDGQAHALGAGDLTITRPWQKHRVGSPCIHASRLLWVILDLQVRRPDEPWHWPGWMVFSREDLKRLTDLLRHCERPVWKATPALRRDFEQLGEQLEGADPGHVETPLKILLNSLLFDLLHMLESRRIALQPELASTRRSVDLFLQSLPEHLDYPWSLDTMAEHCGLGRSRFAHYCEELTNLSPARYLLRCRLETAARLLRTDPERSVTEVALSCGFGSSQYFANAFRQAYGLTPSNYQTQTS